MPDQPSDPQRRWLQNLLVLLAAALTLLICWVFWLVVVRKSSLPPWQMVALPAAFFGFVVGGVAQRWTWGLAATVLAGSVVIAVLGDWETFCQVTNHAVEDAWSTKSEQSAEAWILAKAAEHARLQSEKQALGTEAMSRKPVPREANDPPRAVRLAPSALFTLYRESIDTRLGGIVGAGAIAAMIALQAARMMVRSR